jgi:hypothetical protein
MGVGKIHNEYAAQIKPYGKVPKAVFAAIAVSVLTSGGSDLDQAEELLINEWWTLHENGIVPQKPYRPRTKGGAA